MIAPFPLTEGIVEMAAGDWPRTIELGSTGLSGAKRELLQRRAKFHAIGQKKAEPEVPGPAQSRGRGDLWRLAGFLEGQRLRRAGGLEVEFFCRFQADRADQLRAFFVDQRQLAAFQGEFSFGLAGFAADYRNQGE